MCKLSMMKGGTLLIFGHGSEVKAHLQLVVRASTTGLRAKNGKFPCDAHARRARVAAIRVCVDLLYDKNLKQFQNILHHACRRIFSMFGSTYVPRRCHVRVTCA